MSFLEGKKKEIVQKINKNLIAFEIIILVIILISLGLKSFGIGFWNPLFVFSFGTLAILYYFTGFREISDEGGSKLTRFVIKLSSFGYSMALIAILFKMMQYKNDFLLLKISLTTLVVALAFKIYFIEKSPKNKNFTKPDLIRNVILAGVVAYFYFFT